MCEMITVMDLIKPINIHRPRLEEYNDKLKEGYYGKSDLSCLGGFHCHRQYLNKSWYSCCCNCFSWWNTSVQTSWGWRHTLGGKRCPSICCFLILPQRSQISCWNHCLAWTTWKKTVIIPKGGSYKIHTSYPAWDSFQNLPKFLMFSTLHVCVTTTQISRSCYFPCRSLQNTNVLGWIRLF